MISFRSAEGRAAYGWRLSAASALHVLLVSACAGPSASRPSTAENAEPVPSQAASSAAPRASASPEPAPTVEVETVPLLEATAEAPAEPVAPPEPIELDSWLAGHGVTSRMPKGECWEIGVGVPPEPGLDCKASDPDGSLRARLYRLEQHRLREVWSAVVATSWVELEPEVSTDGSELLVHDRRGCEGAYCEALAKFEQRASPWSWVEMVSRVCRARGRFVWKNGRYIRAKGDEPPPLTRERLEPDLLGRCSR